MAATDPIPLPLVRNHVDRPRHMDGFVLRAADLSLEQAALDGMLARARRRLHGWGVAEGFTLTAVGTGVPTDGGDSDGLPRSGGDALTVGPGYGVTPSGAELFLPSPVRLDGVWALARQCRGDGARDCFDVGAGATAEPPPLTRDVATTGVAWLVAAPGRRLSDPRPAGADPCAHPAGQLEAARACGGVVFRICCVLPTLHQRPVIDTNDVLGRLCEGEIPDWRDDPDPTLDCLVLGALVEDEGVRRIETADRRRLHPTALLQDALSMIICQRQNAPGPAGPTLPGGRPTPDTRPTRPDDVIVGGPTRPPVIVVDEPARPPRLDFDPDLIIEDPRLGPRPLDLVAVEGLRGELTGAVATTPGLLATEAATLAAAGIRTEGEFLTADAGTLAVALNRPVAEVRGMKEAAIASRGLNLRFR